MKHYISINSCNGEGNMSNNCPLMHEDDLKRKYDKVELD